MKGQNVNFNGYSITCIEMTKNSQESKVKEGQLNIETEHYQNNDNKKIHKLVMKLNVVTIKCTINLSLEGYFEFQGKFDNDQINTFLKVNAPSILYPYCRNIISTLSSLDSQDSILLPIINFSNINK